VPLGERDEANRHNRSRFVVVEQPARPAAVEAHQVDGQLVAQIPRNRGPHARADPGRDAVDRSAVGLRALDDRAGSRELLAIGRIGVERGAPLFPRIDEERQAALLERWLPSAPAPADPPLLPRAPGAFGPALDETAAGAIDGDAIAVGGDPTLRIAGDRLYAVSLQDGSVTAIDCASWSVVRTYDVGSQGHPLDIAVVVMWVIYAVNFFGVVIRRRERGLYAAIWFWGVSAWSLDQYAHSFSDIT